MNTPLTRVDATTVHHFQRGDRVPSALVGLLTQPAPAGRLGHELLVDVVELGATAEGWFVATNAPDGWTLARILAEYTPVRGPLPLEFSLRLLLDITDALSHLHEADGPVRAHGALNPENILVGRDGRARLLRSGWAERTGSPQIRQAIDLQDMGCLIMTVLGRHAHGETDADENVKRRLFQLARRANRAGLLTGVSIGEMRTPLAALVDGLEFVPGRTEWVARVLAPAMGEPSPALAKTELLPPSPAKKGPKKRRRKKSGSNRKSAGPVQRLLRAVGLVAAS